MKIQLFRTGLLFFLASFSTVVLAQTGPGGVGNADGSNGQPRNIMWLDAQSLVLTDGNPLNSWTDLSGNTNNATIGESDREPSFRTNIFDTDKAVVRFSNASTGDRLDIQSISSLLLNRNYTVFIVGGRQARQAARWFGGTNSDDNLNLMAGWHDNNTYRFRHRNQNINYNPGAAIDAANVFSLFSHRFDASLATENMELFVNGGNRQTRNTTIPLTSWDGAALGRWKTSYYNIDLAEVVFYNTALNTAQKIIVENYLGAKYGFSVANDVYVGDATGFEHNVAGIGYDGGGEHSAAQSSGFFLATYNGSLDTNGEYLLAGHDNTPNTNTTADLPGGVEERFARTWYLDETGTFDASLAFDITEAFPGGQFPQNKDNYVLLREDGGGIYQIVNIANSEKSIVGSQIIFRVTDTDLIDGEYTLGTVDATNSPVAGAANKVWYSYQTGDWTNPNTWTLDGSNSPLLVNPDNEIPDAIDAVVITSGRTVTMDQNNTVISSLEVIGKLDLASTSGHNFQIIKGPGRIRLQGYDHDSNPGTLPLENFPITADKSIFVDPVDGGKVEVYGTGLILDQPRTWNDLLINLDNPADVVTQLADITLNGRLNLAQGNYRINDNSATTPLDLEVFDEVLIDVNATMSVGEGNAYIDNRGGTYGDYHQGWHEVIAHGDFINNGGVRFTNQAVPEYNAYPNNGAVSLVFRGTSNNIFSCNATTDLYNLVLAKGVDQTYRLELNATDRANFALFGHNRGSENRSGGNNANPENEKALWMKAGILKLTGNVFIPSLTEGGRDYNIGANAKLLLADPNVEVHITADNATDPDSRTPTDWSTFSHGSPTGISDGTGQQTLTLYGNLRIDDGFLWTGRNHGILFRDEAPGVIEVNGGELSAAQISLSGSASAGIYTFSLSGGIIRLTDYRGGARNTNSILHLDNPNVVFSMEGGGLIVEGVSGNATTDGILINPNPGNINVTGGTVRTNYAGTVEINTTAPFYDMVIATHTVEMQSDLKVLNNLTINTGTTRTTGDGTFGGYLDLCPDGTTCYDLEVGRDLNIEDSGVLDVFNNETNNDESATVTLNGTESSTLYIGDITTYQNSLTGHDNPENDEAYERWEFPFYNLTIDKPGATIFLSAKDPDAVGTNFVTPAGGKNVNAWRNNLFLVTNEMTLTEGSTLNQMDQNNTGIGYSVRLYGSTVVNQGTFFVYEDGVTPKNAQVKFRVGGGDITLNTIEGAEFGNIRFNSGNDQVITTSDLFIRRLEYRFGTMNIANHNLRIDVLDVNLAGGQTRTAAGNHIFSIEDMIIMAGTESDGGLSLKVQKNADTSYPQFQGNDVIEYNSNDWLWFPIGTNANTNLRYTPAVCYINTAGTYTGDEYITVRVVDKELQTTDLTAGDILSYYWNVDYEGFEAGEEPEVSWLFQYDNDDDDSGNEATYVPGKVLDGGDYTRSDEGSNLAVKHGGNNGDQGDILGNNPRNIIIFNGIGSNATPDADDNIDGANDNIFQNGPVVDNDWDQAFSGPAGFTLENANYTAGVAARFVGTPQIFYSNEAGSNADWDEGNSWNSEAELAAEPVGSPGVTDEHDDDVNQIAGNSEGVDYPGAGNIAIIGVNPDNGTPHSIRIEGGITARAAIIRFTENTTITQAGRGGIAFKPELTINRTGGGVPTLAIGSIEDEGIILDRNNADPDFSAVDIEDYAAQSGSFYIIENFSNIDTYENLPTILPNLIITSDGFGDNNRTTVLTKDHEVIGDLLIAGGANLELNSDNANPDDGDLIINGDLQLINDYELFPGAGLGDGANSDPELYFPGTSGGSVPSRSIEVYGDLILTRTGARVLINNAGGNNANHTLHVYGNITDNSTDADGGINLYNNTDYVSLSMQGENTVAFTRTNTNASSVSNLYNLIINKSGIADEVAINTDIDLPDPSSINQQPIEILNGTLITNDPAIDITLTDASTGDFLLPNTINPEASSGSGGLEIQQGTIRVEGDDTGIILDGLLRVSGGTLDMNDAANNGNNFIQYSASGNAELEVSDGTLLVGSHIRRNTANTSGILKYRQTGGTMEVGTQAAPLRDRGLFEMFNVGCEFTLTGGDFIINRQNGNNPFVATLVLFPTVYDVSNSTITLGGNTADRTPANQIIRIKSDIPLENITLSNASGNNPGARIRELPLVVDGTFTIGNGTSFDANGKDLVLNGDMISNGTLTPNENTTFFSGATDQQISGSVVPTFYNVVKSTNNTLTLSGTDITIARDLALQNGTLNDGGQTITLQGNMIHDGIHASQPGAGAGLEFAGTALQQLTRSAGGTSTFGKLTINNGLGVAIPDGNDYNFSINDALRLSAGVFDVGSSLLTITSGAIIDEVNTFNEVNMIRTNNSFADNGVRREFGAISSATNILFPVGKEAYTPVNFAISNSSAGSLTVRPANEAHPSIINDAEAPNPEIVDIDNVLQYHWIIKANGLSGFDATASMTYDEATVEFTDPPYTESDYIPARIYETNTLWDKTLPTSNVNTTNNTILFPFNNVTDAQITGDYTAGVTDAIPDEVPTYETSGTDGDYTAEDTWIPIGGAPPVTDGVGPVGAVIVVKSGHILRYNQNSLRAYRTTIEAGGTLEIDGTFGHRLGTVVGTGDIRLVSNTNSVVLPAGFYTDFLNCSGGGLEYAGTGSYDVLGGVSTIRNLTISGSGTRILPSNSIIVCNDLVVNGTATLDNADDRSITVQNNMVLNGGGFLNGAGDLSIDNDLRIAGGTFDGETGVKTVADELTISAGLLDVGSGGSLSIDGNVSYTGGTFNGGEGDAVFSLSGNTLQTISGVFTGASSFHRFQIDNANNVNVTSNIEVNDRLLLTNGIINTNSNDFILTSGANVNPVGGSDNSYINGRAHKEMASGASFQFPIGDGNRYGKVAVNNVSGGPYTWYAEYYNSNAVDDGAATNFTAASPSTTETISRNEYWRIGDDGPGGTTAIVSLRWDNLSDVSSDPGDHSELHVVAWNASTSEWDDYGGTDFTPENTFDSESTLSFSEQVVTLGSGTSENPLPVDLVEFVAEANGSQVQLRWKTASEENNDFFEVQRSEDGKNWTIIGTVGGAGNSTEVLTYNFADVEPLIGISYYRLRQVDFDGMFEYSKVRSVNVEPYDFSSEPNVRMYPNPSSGFVMLRISGLSSERKVAIKLLDVFGKVQEQFTVQTSKLEMGIQLNQRENLPAGLYFVDIKQGKTSLRRKLIIH